MCLVQLESCKYNSSMPDIATPSTPAIPLPFSVGEYAKRLDKVRKAMERTDIDVLFTTDPSNMAWLTGYDGWSFYVPQGVLVGTDGLPLWWGRWQDQYGAVRTVYMGESYIRPYPDHYIQSESFHAMENLAKVIRDEGWGSKRIGVEMDNYYYSAKSHERLTEELYEATFIDATGLVNRERGVKSLAELAYMEKAAVIVTSMMTRAYEVIGPGVRKNDLVAELYSVAIRGERDGNGTRFGGDYPAIVPMLPTGADASAAHLTWDDRVFTKDAGTFLEIAGCVKRYHCPMCRTVYLGIPPDDMRKAANALLEGLEAGLEAATAGNVAGDVARALHGALRRHGVEREGRCGYGVGLSYPPDWGERVISFRESDETVLEPNMTFHFMPGIWRRDWGLEITETIVIQKSGAARCLTKFPRSLLVK